MTAAPTSLCEQWTTEEQVRACCSSSSLSQNADLTFAIEFASKLLFRKSGRRWPGVCTRTVYPPCGCLAESPGKWWDWDYPSIPIHTPAGWINVWPSGCGQCSGTTLTLPGPVNTITEINIGGVELDEDAYLIANYRTIVRIDGGVWPSYNSMIPDDDDSWFITYESGRPVPPDAAGVAAILAREVALAQCGSDDCVLPARLRHISREGVDMDFADPLDFLDQGRVGIYEVDLWLDSVNPNKLARRSRVRRADANDAFRVYT